MRELPSQTQRNKEGSMNLQGRHFRLVVMDRDSSLGAKSVAHCAVYALPNASVTWRPPDPWLESALDQNR